MNTLSAVWEEYVTSYNYYGRWMSTAYHYANVKLKYFWQSCLHDIIWSPMLRFTVIQLPTRNETVIHVEVSETRARSIYPIPPFKSVLI